MAGGWTIASPLLAYRLRMTHHPQRCVVVVKWPIFKDFEPLSSYHIFEMGEFKFGLHMIVLIGYAW